MNRSRIRGTGGYLPDRVVTNAELETMVDTTDRWILERTGIAQRHVAAPHQICSDLAEAAAARALTAAGLTADDIDLVVVATSTPDHVFPSTACRLVERLGIAPGAVAFDIGAACSGFVYGLDMADRFIRTGGAQRALVIGAEVFSRILDWKDRSTCVLFGDGAGAVVLEASDTPGVLSTHLHADGRQTPLLHVPWGVSQGYERLEGSHGKVSMRGNEVFRVAVRTLGALVDETLSANGLERGDVDWLVPHQANIRIMAATARKLGLPPSRMVSTVAEHGNTSAASIPLALDTAVRDGRIQRDELLLLEAFGAGFTWGSALIRY
ncbi:beta-ketoacyl-ACP synthase III [Spiribacter vilamensis]|uniref:Beta-ketoacyl-[acyl-carrier-protein] synthase III n=1 Tax=Spiribacter vilamensis TaxID=531306 RepID=A0A4Q8CZR0_9GAMM|nr:beta-ketoacyl-ACP synthase III [Spiribacter vilamensis]RZU98526.1 3-oxoacyl-[acyl-carrier-protein] synthase-3 [Spiribacter vilamensis]TVO60612.1 ketoacyl-ACP synthase III [Spiribacter vilamensis]